MSDRRRFSRKVFLAAVAILSLIAAVVVVVAVDFTPRIESDFFFSTDDPQLRATQEIEALFPSSPQILLSATGVDPRSGEDLDKVRHLTEELQAVPGVATVQSLTNGPPTPVSAAESPVWRRLLLGENPRRSQLVILLEDPLSPEAGSAGELVERIEEIVTRFDAPSFSLAVSGVPYVLEQIRRRLLRDLKVFTLAAFLVFGLLMSVVYRSLRLMAGTLLACLAAGAVTLAGLYFLDIPIGLLTANLITIVFVLTLSHIVFLTANWRAEHARSSWAGEDIDREALVERAVRSTLGASFWCMVTTFLGFASLVFASAKPLRELGISGSLGAAVAIVVAYGLYPFILGTLAAPPPARVLKVRHLPSRRALTWGVSGIAVAVVVAALGLPRLDTDPTLLDYFAPDDELRASLELIDEDGGSSPLYLVVSDGGERLDTEGAQERLAKLQEALETEADVGVALSLPVLLDEARRVPLARFLSAERLVDFLLASAYGDVVRGFIDEERTRALFFLRLREAGRTAPRREVVATLVGHVEASGLELELSGGLYDLQGKLGELVASSLLGGLTALFVLFVGIAFIVGRSWRFAGAMVVSLLAVPVVLLGVFGHLRVPLDIISSPAANVAIALGIDSMIHLVVAARRRLASGEGLASAWRGAALRLWPAVAGATFILASGFGLFALSSFPPTQRFGVAVALGTSVAAVMALVVLPYLATLGGSGHASSGDSSPKTSSKRSASKRRSPQHAR